MKSHLSFSIRRSQVVEGIFIPKFYDPDVEHAHQLAEESGFDLPYLEDILDPGAEGSRLGNWIRREHYGSGGVPYVRTSDLSHWRIRPDWKKGVSEALYDSLSEKQDIQVSDILFVAHGTYLVGNVAMVTTSDQRMVLQDHVFRLRVSKGSEIRSALLLGALSTGYVRRQVRSRQFSADIIDKIGNRHLKIRIPIPRSTTLQKSIASRVQQVIERQTVVRRDMASVSQSNLRMTRERAPSNYGFTVKRRNLIQRILIPKYYDPDLEDEVKQHARAYGEQWIAMREIVESGQLSAITGVEVGKLAYGTGRIPFLRTSDLTEWEVKRDPKQGVSREIYERYEGKASLEANDVLLVRDGTYLVGSTAIVTQRDTPALFCGGMYRLRLPDSPEYAAFALLAFLSLPVVRRQMRARQFTRDVIDTLGHRLLDVRIPSPFSGYAEVVGGEVEKIIDRKAEIKGEIGKIIGELEPPSPPRTRDRPGWSMR